MSRDMLLKVAAVLEGVADVLESQEAEKVAADRKARDEAVALVASKYASFTGEELSEEELSKLAASGEALSMFRRLVEKTASDSVESLGRSSEHPSAPSRPMSKKEAAQKAWESFGDFINS